MTAPLLEICGLSVSFRRGKAVTLAAHEVSFDVAAGETVGWSGSLGQVNPRSRGPSSGWLPSSRLGALPRRGHQPFGLCRAPPLVPACAARLPGPLQQPESDRTIGRTLAEPLQAYGERDRALVQARVHGMLDRVQLPAEAADRYPGELSGGQRQRVAIARSLMLSPQLVILDEPLSALDLSVQAQILNLLQELQAASGLSYVFISHDLEVVRYLCDRVVVMYQGQVMETGPAGRVSGRRPPLHVHVAPGVAGPRSAVTAAAAHGGRPAAGPAAGAAAARRRAM